MTWLHRAWRIDAALAGNLSASAEEALRRHLRSCAGCRRRYDEGVRALRLASGREAGPGELRRLEALALRALARESGAGTVRSPWRRAVVLAPAAGIAVVLVAVTATLIWRQQSSVGVVLARSGEVRIDAQPAEPGDPIAPGALVSAPRGDALLQLRGGRQALIRQGGALQVGDGGSLVTLAQGRARFEVDRSEGPNPFAVVVDDVRVEVQGTVFAVERREGGGMLVGVKEGKVRVKAPRSEVLVAAGQETTVAEGTAAPPRPATDAALAEDRGRGIDLLRWLTTQGARALRRFQDSLGRPRP